ncbi:DUF892 family protein [Mucilaginibacter gilvus]|uniref:DUF892 family protein n=1 Tax=Mucilaginibacter gilvus TaxID=2305909 RepID=A0A3S3VDT2_9SPHI|nr:DUF892 family protein [Mucilaginibacter gilvus]
MDPTGRSIYQCRSGNQIVQGLTLIFSLFLFDPGRQKVEYYEIATYGGLRTLAPTKGRDDVAELLQ